MIEPNTHVYIATPSYDWKIHVQYHVSMLTTWHVLEERGVTITEGHPQSDALMGRVRASLVNNFLSSPEFTHLMWIDSDLGWDPNDVVRLIETGKEIVGGIYRKRTDTAMTFPVVLLDGDKVDIDETGCFEVKYLPGGFCLMQRSAVMKMVAAYPERRVKLRDGGWSHPENAFAYDLFPTLTDTDGTFLSEDYSFCNLWRAIGGKCWCLPQIKLRHIGQKPFDGCLADFLPLLVKKGNAHGTA